MTIPASELAAWSELAEKAIADDARYTSRLVAILPRLLSAYSQSQARVAELEKAIEKHHAEYGEYGTDRDAALWSVLPQSEGATT